MKNVATSVRIAGDAIQILSKLSGKLGQSKAQVIECALKEMEERLFWVDVSNAFNRIAAEPAELARVKAEAGLWESGTARDWRGEDW